MNASITGNFKSVVRRALAIAILAPILPLSGLLPAADQGTTVFSPGTSPPGKTWAEWSAEWQKWFISIPIKKNPAYDNGPCDTEQSGPVWFISGSGTFMPVRRQCTVPTGKVLLLTLINAECSDVEPGPFYGADTTARQKCAAAVINGVSTGSLRLTIDEVPVGVNQLRQYRVQSPEYRFTMPRNDNVLFVTSGATSGLSVSDGYFLFLQLAPGSHVVHFEAAFVSGPGAGSKQDVTYDFLQQ